MISTLNKCVLFAFVLLLLTLFTITGRGQGFGFQLRGPLTFVGFHAGDPVWAVGKGFRLTAVEPALHKHLRELEGQTIRLTVEPATK